MERDPVTDNLLPVTKYGITREVGDFWLQPERRQEMLDSLGMTEEDLAAVYAYAMREPEPEPTPRAAMFALVRPDFAGAVRALGGAR